MSRLFDGSDDQSVHAIGSCDVAAGAHSFVQLVKFDAGGSWSGGVGIDHPTNGSELALGRNGSAQQALFRGGGAGGRSDAGAIGSADGWVLQRASRPAGASQTVRMTKYPIGGSPTHANGSSTFSNGISVTASGLVRFGPIDGADFFKGRVAAYAIYAANLSDADCESLVTTLTLANWLAKGAVGLWDERDAFATDHTGNGATQTSLVGTTDDADDPTGWASWAAAAAAEIPHLVMAPPIPA